MSNLADIKAAQDSLEESFSKRMAELESQLHSGGPSKDTVAKVAEEFRTFKELMYSMLGVLRKQINECTHAIDSLETRHRRNALIFLGVPEADKEDCKALVLKVVQEMIPVKPTTADISVCHRLGAASKDHARPILVWFSSIVFRMEVWKAKTRLKGTSTSVKEFLTRTRQMVFGKARQQFGMRACWTQDGVVVVKTSDGSRHRVTTSRELDELSLKFPKVGGACNAEKGGGKPRK